MPEASRQLGSSRPYLGRFGLVPDIAGLLRSGTFWPGIVLVATIAASAFSIRLLPGLALFSPIILAVIVGIAFSNVVGKPTNTVGGIAFCQRALMRFAIVLLGFQLTMDNIQSIGLSGIGIVVLTLVSTFCFTMLAGRVLRVDRKLTELIAAGTSICGASAIVAVNAVTSAREEDVAYAVASITLFGSIAMLTFPLLVPVLGLGHHEFGLWAGASIHEVAQVVAAGFQDGTQAGEIGTITKLIRVVMLAPVVVVLRMLAHRAASGEASAKPPKPWFVAAFIGVVALNSVIQIPDGIRHNIALLTTFFLSMGLAAMGLQTDISRVRSRGLRPLMVALSASIFVAGFSLFLVKVMG